MAQAAVALQPDEANYLDTLAEVLLSSGDKSEALKVMERAAHLDAKYQSKLTQFRQAAGK